MSPTDINVPITGSLALNQKVSLFQCLAYLNNKSLFVNKYLPCSILRNIATISENNVETANVHTDIENTVIQNTRATIRSLTNEQSTTIQL